MNISEFSLYLQRLEDTPKRLEITDILSELIKKLSDTEIDKAIYLSLGYLKAQYESQKFNMADKMIIKALAKAYECDEDIVVKLNQKEGDLGNVAEILHNRAKTSDLTSISVISIHERLMKIAETEGSGSQDKKIYGVADLLQQLDALSAKFIVRIVLGTTRLGFTELTIIDALSNFISDSKDLKTRIESSYFVHPDIGLIAKQIKSEGISGIDKIVMETGIPIEAQKAQRIGGLEETMQKMGECWAEYKFDGTRAQLHIDKSKKFTVDTQQQELFASITKEDYLVKTFTRNLEDSTHQFPDIVDAAMTQIDADSVILDGEVIGLDKKTGEFLPFQQIMQRKRKHAVKEMSEEIPLKYFVFDILYLNGKPLVDLPLEKRNELLQKVIKPGRVIEPAQHIRTNDLDTLFEYYEKAKEMNLEGLIVKKPQDPYKAGARSFSWVKLKRADEKLLDDSIDAVVLGYYGGRGERSKFGIGKFLIGVYDEKQEKFLTVSKVGTGLKEEDLVYLKEQADKVAVKAAPINVDIPKAYTPDVITRPTIVVEVGGDEITISKSHSAGYAIRFPRLLYFRTDKKAEQATTQEEVAKLFSMQQRGNYKND